MNRICQTSYGTLEVVLNLAGYKGNSNRQLVHVYRDRFAGTWHDAGIVTSKPSSGGSIIQNLVKTNSQGDGNLEVIVLEDNGRVKHYTRKGATYMDGITHRWQLAGTVNADRHPYYGKIVASEASPIFQCSFPAPESKEYTLETVLVDAIGNAFHYCCYQAFSSLDDTTSYRWVLGSRITTGAVGPVWLYQDSKEDGLKALIPQDKGIFQYSFVDGVWSRVSNIFDGHAFACTFRPNPTLPSRVYVAMKEGGKSIATDMVGKHPLLLSPGGLMSRTALGRGHQTYRGHPVAIVSQFQGTLGYSSNAEAISIQPCGTGWHDTWMVLHWSYLTNGDEWKISGVLLSCVEGIPM
ncbi:uncharacterized protein GGS25DRAFT_525794 [Hypoxylon fragiforme]|uniref:uncharacterized protein n=1 Tax=Hypoxylon fragiforme TaxID=63214 RepID=UPI0020C60962|nr:uncharacterized protein GGS25DRAFT_525794 [Hypoxylon fragiforme]KAI2604506.1 hypothetical protein GGS25DRAFT_525794 [Hypoxylon fragiforme]